MIVILNDNSLVCSSETYPIGTHLDGVGLSGVWVLSKGFVPSSASDGVPILEDSEIMDRGIGECLLKGMLTLIPDTSRHLFFVTHSSCDACNSTTTASC